MSQTGRQDAHAGGAKPGWVRWLASAGVVTAVIAGAIALGRAWHWPIEVVRIEGAVVHSDRARLKETVAGYTRQGFFGLELEALQGELVGLPWVRSASLRRVWPHTLQVTIEEHKAVATWNGKALLSRSGEVFEPETVVAKGRVRLSGPAGTGPAMLERLRALRSRLGAIEPEIVGLHQDTRRAWRVELDNGVTLRLGQQGLAERLERFAAVWQRALSRHAEAVAAVDLRYTSGLAVAWDDEVPAGVAPEQPDEGAGDV